MENSYSIRALVVFGMKPVTQITNNCHYDELWNIIVYSEEQLIIIIII